MTELQRYYQEQVFKTWGWNKEIENAESIHRCIGLRTEIAEIENVFKYIYRPQGKHIDKVNLLEELGDVLFYLYTVRDKNYSLEFPKLSAKDDFERVELTLHLINEMYFYFNLQMYLSIHTLALQIGNLWGFSFEEIINKNVAKLQKRYENGYSLQADLNRDLQAEREVLQ